MIYRFFLISCCLVFLGNMSFHIYVHIKCCNFFRLKTIFFAGNCYVQKYTYIFCERKLKYQMLSNPEAMKKLDEKIYIQRIRKGNEIYLLAVQSGVIFRSSLKIRIDFSRSKPVFQLWTFSDSPWELPANDLSMWELLNVFIKRIMDVK